MAAPSYTTDLTDITECETNSGWSEASGHTTGGADATETETLIQKSGAVSQSTGQATGTGAGMVYVHGSNLFSSFATGDCVFMWQIFTSPAAIDTWANGGMRIGVGSSDGNIKWWKSMGNDFGNYPYGGWQNTAIDPTFTADYTDGSPAASNYTAFGSLTNLLAKVTKGNPHVVDVIRYGRGEVIIEHGDLTNGYGTFAGVATENDYDDATNGYHRWGLFQQVAGAYLWKGLLSFGNATNACDFRDSNRVITIDETPRTYAAFNKIEINNASSRVDWTAINFSTLNESGLSRGQFEMVDNATVNFDGCVFTGMDTFSFDSNATVDACTFRRCNAITMAGAGNMSNSTVDSSTVAADTSALVWNLATDPSGKLDNMTFIKGTNAHHAIEFGTSIPSTINLVGLTFTGFNASNGQNDSALHFKDTSGTITVNYSGAAPSYKTDGATISLVQTNTLTVNVDKDTASEIRVMDAGTTTVIAGTETIGATKTWSTGIDATTYPSVDIMCISLDYTIQRRESVSMTSDKTIDFQQSTDRQYDNP